MLILATQYHLYRYRWFSLKRFQASQKVSTCRIWLVLKLNISQSHVWNPFPTKVKQNTLVLCEGLTKSLTSFAGLLIAFFSSDINMEKAWLVKPYFMYLDKISIRGCILCSYKLTRPYHKLTRLMEQLGNYCGENNKSNEKVKQLINPSIPSLKW